MKYFTTKKITYMALLAALTTVSTTFLSFPNGIGYTNLGDTFILISASFFDPFFAFIVGGIGSALADVFLGYAQYAIPTFFIKGLEGLITAIILNLLLKKIKPTFSVVISMLFGVLFMVFGYFLTNCLLYSPYQAVISLPNDFLQAFLNLALGFVLTLVLLKIRLFNNSNKLTEKFYEKRTRNK